MFKKPLMLLTLLAPVMLFGAFEEVLIDFNKLAALTNDSDKEIKSFASSDNWKVTLNTSADFLANRRLSYTKWTPCDFSMIKDNKAIDGATSGNVLGVRASFAKSDYNAYVSISPEPIGIKIFGGSNGELFQNRGVIQNVGLIKNVRAWVKGKHYPHAMFINLRDQDGIVTQHFMDYLNYDGWKELTFKNLNYLENARDRKLKHSPGYPRIAPAIAFDSMSFVKDGGIGPNGDFIAYVAWIKLDYDKAVITEKDDIDDEASWGIIKSVEDEKKGMEEKRLRRYTELIDLERQKMNLPPQYGTPENGTAPTK